MRIECLTKLYYSNDPYCNPDGQIGDCGPSDLCGPIYGSECMPDCSPNDA